MIVLDTHIWVWWVSEADRLSETQRAEIEAAEQSGRGVSAISCWEVASWSNWTDSHSTAR